MPAPEAPTCCVSRAIPCSIYHNTQAKTTKPVLEVETSPKAVSASVQLHEPQPQVLSSENKPLPLSLSLSLYLVLSLVFVLNVDREGPQSEQCRPRIPKSRANLCRMEASTLTLAQSWRGCTEFRACGPNILTVLTSLVTNLGVHM